MSIERVRGDNRKFLKIPETGGSTARILSALDGDCEGLKFVSERKNWDKTDNNKKCRR